MKFDWKKSIKKYCLDTASLRQVLGPVDEHVVSLALLRIRSAENAGPLTVICSDTVQAEKYCAEVSDWINTLNLDWTCAVLPDGPAGKTAAIAETETARTKVLYTSLTNPPDFLFASVAAILQRVPDPQRLAASELTLRCGMELSPAGLVEHLLQMDYDDEPEVSVQGEFSKRGGIVDVFSLCENYPARIEYFGDEVDTIRLFHPENQRSFESVSSYRVILRGNGESFFDYNEEHGRQNDLDFFDYLAVNQMRIVPVFSLEIEKRLTQFCEAEALTRWQTQIQHFSSRVFNVLDAAEAAEQATRHIDTEPFLLYPGNANILQTLPEGAEDSFADLAKQVNMNLIRQWLSEKYYICLAGGTEKSYRQIKEWIRDNDLQENDHLQICKKHLPVGIFFPSEKIACLSERDLFVVSARRFRKRLTAVPAAGENENNKFAGEDFDQAAFADLEEGDYAVHINHGICIYRGLKTIQAGGAESEMIVLEFSEDMVLNIPVWQAHYITRYIGSRKGQMQLSRLNSAKWGKTKSTAAQHIRNLAFDMLNLQAIRAKSHGTPFPPDDLSQRLFEESFPFQETADQLRSIEEIKADMEGTKPMDRLLCGDVGYGKTEVAMRAAYKCVSNGRQTAILVPTTVLAQQHYYSFLERFAGTPVLIEQLSRFRSKKEQAEILERLKNGTLDIVIGTHALISKQVQFKDLGLIIIDEEQRFGVLQKEFLKRLRTTVDVLTMTATPIPRTLYLSMAGIRDLSTIMSAPVQRLPVQTIVAQNDDSLLLHAVNRELQRGGQVYYLFNRVAGIADEAQRLQLMFPHARIGVGHGQMPEHELEQVMSDFIEGKVDILVSTTIIESGLDIPNANTIIIDRADRFGLAELYQLRGRVGRWSRQAYAYLLLPRSGILAGDAKKRIAAIRRYTHLGAGFKLAMRDLEIRGSGNILGAEQSGQINAIGFHLYCQLLRSCVAALKGEQIVQKEHREIDLFLDFLDYSLKPAKGHIAACFPESYIEIPKLRIEAYRKLSGMTSIRELENYRMELRDRFGHLPAESENLFCTAKIRILAADAGMQSVACRDERLYVERGRTVVKPDGLIPRIPNTLLPEERLQKILTLMESISAANSNHSSAGKV